MPPTAVTLAAFADTCCFSNSSLQVQAVDTAATQTTATAITLVSVTGTSSNSMHSILQNKNKN